MNINNIETNTDSYPPPHPNPKSILFKCDNIGDFKKNFCEYSHKKYFGFVKNGIDTQENYDKELNLTIEAVNDLFDNGYIIALCDDTLVFNKIKGHKYIAILHNGSIKKRYFLTI